MAKVYVSLGSNIDRERNIEQAIADLHEAYGELEQSRTYETQAVGFEGDPFYNLVVAFETGETPRVVASREKLGHKPLRLGVLVSPR